MGRIHGFCWEKGGKRKVIKKKRGKLLAAVLAAAMLIPQSVMTVGAADDPQPVFTYEETANVTNGTNAITASEHVETMKASEAVTVNLTFTATGSGVQSLFFMGDSSAANNYITVYLSGSTLGVEYRDASGNHQISDKTCTIENEVDLAQPHALTFVMEGTSYKFYLDGQQVKNSSSSSVFNAKLTAADYIGFGNGARNGNTYPLTGTLSNIELYNTALTEEQIKNYYNGGLRNVVFSSDSAYYPAGTETADYKTVTDAGEISKLTELTSGSITVRYRVEDGNTASPQMLIALSNSAASGVYLGLYVTPSTNTIGIDAVGLISGMLAGKKLSLNSYPGKGVTVNNTNWHTITVTKADNDLKLHVDGVYIDHWSGGMSEGFLNLVSNADTLGIGKVVRSSGNAMPMNGAIDSVTIYSSVLTDAEIQRADSVTRWTAEEELDMTNAYKSETEDLFYAGYKGSSSYRIPSLLTTKTGTQLAFIDERNSGPADNGNIDAVVRRKAEGETVFSDPITLVDLPNNGNSAAFAIDMVTVQDQSTGKIFAFVDMFPESSGLMDTSQLTAGVGYENVNGVMCQTLYNAAANPKERFGYISNIENGIGHVLNDAGEDTGYTVVIYPYEAGVALEEKGNLYKDGEYRGNIYMLKNGPDKGELCVLNTSYLWLVTSEDDGLTWSDPVDITPQVKEDWALFFGTGPGVGIQLTRKEEYRGRLVVPIYTANSNVGGSQSSAVIYSDDHGATWELGESPQELRGYDRENMNSNEMLTEAQAVELDNGNVLLFMRNNFSGKVQVATSTDGGATWDKIGETKLTDVYCQLSVIHYTKPNGEEYVLLSNPSRSGRYNGKMYLGQVQENGSMEWKWEREINSASERFAYSCLTLVSNPSASEDPNYNNPKFAIMYEDETTGAFRIRYFEFDENYIKAGTVTPDEMAAPRLLSADVQVENSTVTVSLTFDQTIMAAGTPRLSLTNGSESETVTAEYKSGSGTDTIVFTAEMAEVSGILKATALDLRAGLLENIQNKRPELDNIELYTNTEVKGMTVSAYTSQHSDSIQPNTDGAAVNVIDGNPNTYWHSTYGNNQISLPQSVTLDLGEEKMIYKVDYLARQNNQSGRVHVYGIEVSNTGTEGEFTEVARGTLTNTTDWQEIEIIPTNARYVRFVAYQAYSTITGSCSLAELKVHEYSDGVIEQGNEERLEALVNAADELAEENYSAVTWEAYEAALSAARAVLAADGPVSQNLIDRTAENLKDAQDALVDISRAADRFAAIKADKDKYTPASWEVFEAWMAEHEQELADADTSKAVTDMVVALVYQAGQLAEKADKTALQALLTEYTETAPLTEDGYEADSWNRYQTAITAAQSVVDNANASAQDVTDAIAELTTARTELKADMSELQTLYDTYSALKDTDYLPNDGWTAMQSALTEADAMLQAGTAAPSQVVDMIAKLNEAYQALALRPGTEALTTLYDALKKELADLSVYMSEGVRNMEAAFKAAEAVLADPRTETQVQEQMEALNAAYNALVLKATNEQILDLTGLEESLSHMDVSGLSEAQRQQVQEVREELLGAIAANEISADYAVELLQKAEAAMALAGTAGQPGNPSGGSPSGNNPSGSALSGTASGTNTSDKGKAVMTGDTADFGWMILMLAVSVTAAAVVYRRRSEKN